MSSNVSRSALLSLPPELRNQIYDLVASDTEQITIRNGAVLPHSFSQVCRQIRNEFGPLFKAMTKQSPPYLSPATIKIQLENFDFNQTVQAIDRCRHDSNTRFEVEIWVTKQLHRSDWEKMWSWVSFCDELAYRKDAYDEKVLATYKIGQKFGSCNVYAACHEMYIEVVPYILNGNARGGCTSAGYEQIEKMRLALSTAIGN